MDSIKRAEIELIKLDITATNDQDPGKRKQTRNVLLRKLHAHKKLLEGILSQQNVQNKFELMHLLSETDTKIDYYTYQVFVDMCENLGFDRAKEVFVIWRDTILQE